MNSLRIAGMATLILFALATTALSQDFDFGAFAEGILDEVVRQEQREQADEYRRQQQERYGRYQQQSRGYDGRYRELYSNQPQQGQYVIDSPLGPVGIRFAPGGPGSPGRVSGSQYGEYLATRLDETLSQMHGVLQGTGTAGVPRAIRKAQEEVDQMRETFRNDNRQQAREHFRDFEDAWNNVQRALSQAQNLPQPRRLYELKRQADDLRDELAAMLENGRDRGRHWDRVTVAALVDRLERQTDALREHYEREIGHRRDGVLDRLTRRVRNRARDLYQAVHNDDPYDYVVEEYRAFDDAWHDLRAMLASRRWLDEAFGKIDRNVSIIDQRLHYQLRVEPPAAGRGRTTLGVAAGIARSADELIRELRRQNAYRGALRDSSEALVYQSEQLSQMLRTGPVSDRRISEQLDRVDDLTDEVADQVEDRDVSRYARQLIDSLEASVERLQERIG